MLSYARSLGEQLIVGIDSDTKVKQDKGEGRPYNTEQDRVYMLEALSAVDRVIVFKSAQELEENMKNIRPDVMVVGADWKYKKVIGAEHVKKLIFFDRIGEYSTTKILEASK